MPTQGLTVRLCLWEGGCVEINDKGSACVCDRCGLELVMASTRRTK